MCVLKKLLGAIIIPPVYTGHEVIPSKRVYSVSDGGQKVSGCSSHRGCLPKLVVLLIQNSLSVSLLCGGRGILTGS